MYIIGKQLTAIRKLRKMSCDALSQKLTDTGKPYTRNTISRKCNDRGGKTSEAAVKDIANALQIDADVLTDETAYNEYMEALTECKKKIADVELDEGILGFFNLICDYLRGKDKCNKFEYVYRLAEDEKFKNEMECEMEEWKERLEEIDSLMKEKSVSLGVYDYLYLEREKGKFHTLVLFAYNEKINNAFCMKDHELLDFGELLENKIIFDPNKFKDKIRNRLRCHDTGSDILNEKLREYVDRQGINYRLKQINIVQSLNDANMELQLDELYQYLDSLKENELDAQASST